MATEEMKRTFLVVERVITDRERKEKNRIKNKCSFFCSGFEIDFVSPRQKEVKEAHGSHEMAFVRKKEAVGRRSVHPN